MKERTRRRLHWSLHALGVLGLAGTFVGSAAVAVIVHADLPVAHRLAARAASFGLTELLNGKVTVGSFRYIHAKRLRVSSIRLFDAYGKEVVTLGDVRVRFDLWTILEDTLFNRRGTTVILNHIRVERTDIEFIADPKTAEPTIVHAITPRAASEKSKGPPDPYGVRVFLPIVELGSVVAHARLRDQPDLTADLRGVHGQFLSSPKGIAVDITRFATDLRGFGADARGTSTLSVRAPGPARASFEGFVGDVELKADATLTGNHLDAHLDVPSATPKAMTAMVPSWPFVAPMSVHVEASGDLPVLRTHAVAAAGAANLTIDGPVTLGNAPRAELGASGHHLDLRVLSPEAPRTDLSVEAAFVGELRGNDFVAGVNATSDATVLADQPIPKIDWTANIEGGAVKGKATIHETGAPIDASFDVAKGVVEIDAKAANFDLGRTERLGGALKGRGQARLRARVEKGALRGSIEADVSNLGSAGAEVDHAHATLDVSGPLGTPNRWTIASKATGQHLHAFGFDADQVQATAKGDISGVTFTTNLSGDEIPTIDAQGKAKLLGGVALEHAHVTVRRDPVTVEGDVAELDPEKKIVAIENLRVAGAGGDLTGSLRVAPTSIRVRAEGNGVDLDTLSRALGLARGTLGGKMRISADVEAAHDFTRGHLRAGVDDATIGMIGGLTGKVALDLDGATVDGSASGKVLGFGTFDAKWKSELSGPAFELASWQDVIGNAEVSFGDLDLATLRAVVPKNAPIQGIAGRGTAKFLLERKKRADRLPNVFASFRTENLVVDVKRSGTETPLRIQGIDAAATGGFNGVTGDSTGTTVLSDLRGELVAATGQVRVNVEELMRNPARVVADLLDAPVNLVLTVPERALSDFPEVVRPAGVTGVVRAAMNLHGTLSKPTFFASIDGSGVGALGARPGRAVDVHSDAQYESATAELVARATAVLQGRRVAGAAFQGIVPVKTPEKWTGEAHAELSELPLELSRGLADSGVRGKLSGKVVVDRRERPGKIDATLDVDDAFVGGTPLGAGKIQFETDGPTAEALVSFSAPRGKLDASGGTAIEWTGAFPELAPDAPVRLRLVAKDFEAGVLSPFVSGVLSRVGGRFDADMNVSLAHNVESGSTALTGGIEGTAALRDGSLLIDVLGLEVRNVSLSAEAKGTAGTTELSVKDLRGRVRSTNDNLHGSADLTLEGLTVARGSADLDLADVPILFRGAPQGRVTGHTTARLERQKQLMFVDVDVPKLDVNLPQASTRNVIDLGDNPDFEIIQLATEKAEEGDVLPWRLAVHLDKVGLHRSDLDLAVSGTPTVDLGAETRVSGGIEVSPGGRVPVLGKVFVIEHGNVLFDTGDSSNPDVDVTAAFRTPTDSTVYIDMVGPMRQAKLTLRSDPPLPEPEVFALLVGGNTAEPSATQTQTTEGGAAAGAVAMNSGVAALGVNQLIANNPLELRVDTTSESLPRYTAAVRIRQDLWFEASTYQQSEGAGTGTDRNVFSGTVDYRFARRWSLRTEVGTVGGAMDLLWQYRY